MFLQAFNSVLNTNRRTKRAITLIGDSFFIALSFWAALVIRLDNLIAFSNVNYWLMLSGLLPVSLMIFIKLGLYRAVLRYMSSKAVWSVVAGTMLSTAVLVLLAFFSSTVVPRTMPLIYCAFILLTVGGARLIITYNKRKLIGYQNSSSEHNSTLNRAVGTDS
jgi:FlaA1/EpsC-like NDP-sugar epimerase